MDKVSKLKVYLQSLLDRRSGGVPPKHSAHPKEFHQFLDNEIASVKSKIDSLKLESK